MNGLGTASVVRAMVAITALSLVSDNDLYIYMYARKPYSYIYVASNLHTVRYSFFICQFSFYKCDGTSHVPKPIQSSELIW